MSKIVFTDTDYDNLDIEERLTQEAGIELAVFHERDPKGIIEAARDADGACLSYGQYTREVFDALPNLKVVSRTGVGYDNIDLEAATDHGVAVCTQPGYGTEVVSDHAITLALGVLRRVNELDAKMRQSRWGHESVRPLGQVHGRTFGVIGMGEIGRAVAKKANGLGFHVICWSRSLVPGRRTPEGYDILTLDEVLAQSDVVSFHTALTPATHHLLNAQKLALMKPTAVVVNTSRGAVVDTQALADALRENKLWGAGIDVFEEEPVDPNHPLLSAPHTLLTPHVAYWSEESAVELRTRTIQCAIDVVSGRAPADCLNPQVLKK